MNVPTIKVKARKVRSFEHYVVDLTPSCNNRLVVAAGGGKLSLVAESGKRMPGVEDIPIEPSVHSVSNDGRYLATYGKGHLIVKDFVEGKVNEIEMQEVHQCFYDEINRLWVITDSSSGKGLGVAILKSPDWDGVTKDILANEVSYSYGTIKVYSTGVVDRILICAVNNSPEFEFFFVVADESDLSLKVENQPIPAGDKHLIVAPHGQEIVALDHDDPGLVRYTSPFVEENQRIAWPFHDSNADEKPGRAGCYLDLVHVLIASEEGRFYILHTRSMTLIAELSIKQFKPYSMSKKYDVEGLTGICSDIILIDRCGDNLIAISDGGMEEEPDLAVIEIKDIFSAIQKGGASLHPIQPERRKQLDFRP